MSGGGAPSGQRRPVCVGRRWLSRIAFLSPALRRNLFFSSSWPRPSLRVFPVFSVQFTLFASSALFWLTGWPVSRRRRSSPVGKTCMCGGWGGIFERMPASRRWTLPTLDTGLRGIICRALKYFFLFFYLTVFGLFSAVVRRCRPSLVFRCDD